MPRAGMGKQKHRLFKGKGDSTPAGNVPAGPDRPRGGEIGSGHEDGKVCAWAGQGRFPPSIFEIGGRDIVLFKQIVEVGPVFARQFRCFADIASRGLEEVEQVVFFKAGSGFLEVEE